MKKRRIVSALVLFLSIVFVSSVEAIPIVSIDNYEVVIGDIFSVDVWISNVDPALPVAGFEFDIDYDPTILTPLSIVDGGYLPSPLGIPPFVVESDLNPPDINFAMTTIGWGGGSGSGILATITFQGTNIGASPLDLNDVILAAPGGTPITPVTLNDGSVNVTPEPATFLLIGSGIIGIFGLKRKKII